MAVGDQQPLAAAPAGRRPRISLRAAGGTYLSPPAHEAGLSGGAYRYGRQVVGGITNMVSNGQVLYPLIKDQVLLNGYNLTLGGGFYDVIRNARRGQYGNYLAASDNGFAENTFYVNGEAVYSTPTNFDMRDVTNEAFTTAGTVDTVSFNSTIITFAGSTLTTYTLPGYAYVPCKNKIGKGDVLEVTVAAVKYYYRVQSVTDNTHLVVFPAWQQGSAGPGAGYAYRVLRTGFNSRSRVIPIPSSTAEYIYCYLAGNTTGRGFDGAGRIECVTVTQKHFMGPQTATGAAEVRANDIAMYKSFLLYGAGTAVGWSVAGFPTSFPFGTTDFPAANIAVLDPSDEFVCFEYLGDTLLAIYENSVWMIRPTGSVPEFDFQRMPLGDGPKAYYASDTQLTGTNTYTFTRPTTTADAAVYWYGLEGMIEYRGWSDKSVSPPMDAFPFQALGQPETYELCYEKTTRTVIMRDPKIQKCLAYNTIRGEWTVLDPILGNNFSMNTYSCLFTTPNINPANPYRRPFTVTYYDCDNKRLRQFSQTIDAQEFATYGTYRGWIWASLVAYLSDTYGDYNIGGIAVRARAAIGATAGQSQVVIQFYGGQSPYLLNTRGSPITVDVQDGTPSSRFVFGPTIDDPYVAYTVSGTGVWIELLGIDIYDTTTTARR